VDGAAMDLEKVRGTERVNARRDNILDIKCVLSGHNK
jgi:hypothetical protein